MNFIYLVTILMTLMVHAYGQDVNPLCNCYSVSSKSISGLSFDEIICYTYSITIHSENDQCNHDILNIILGVCNDNDMQFNSESLQESITNIIPNQDIITSNELKDSMIGLKLQIHKNIEVCMKNVNINRITSNNVGFVLNNNDIITCNNDPNQSGLPCKSIQLSIIDSQKNIGSVAKYIEEDNGYDRIDIPQTENLDISKEIIKSKGISVSTRSYIRFAFVGIMVFIFLNAMFCILLALRQSGALDDIKYFNQIDTAIETVDKNINENNNIIEDIDSDNIDDESDNSDDGSDNDFSPILKDISFSDLIAMRSANGHSISDSNFKIMISLSKLEEENQNLKKIQLNSDIPQFME